MTINVFSKSNKDVQEIKDLSTLNKKYLLFSNKVAKSYNKLPKRIYCKNCSTKLLKNMISFPFLLSIKFVENAIT